MVAPRAKLAWQDSHRNDPVGRRGRCVDRPAWSFEPLRPPGEIPGAERLPADCVWGAQGGHLSLLGRLAQLLADPRGSSAVPKRQCRSLRGHTPEAKSLLWCRSHLRHCRERLRVSGLQWSSKLWDQSF